MKARISPPIVQKILRIDRSKTRRNNSFYAGGRLLLLPRGPTIKLLDGPNSHIGGPTPTQTHSRKPICAPLLTANCKDQTRPPPNMLLVLDGVYKSDGDLNFDWADGAAHGLWVGVGGMNSTYLTLELPPFLPLE